MTRTPATQFSSTRQTVGYRLNITGLSKKRQNPLPASLICLTVSQRQLFVTLVHALIRRRVAVEEDEEACLPYVYDPTLFAARQPLASSTRSRSQSLSQPLRTGSDKVCNILVFWSSIVPSSAVLCSFPAASRLDVTHEWALCSRCLSMHARTTCLECCGLPTRMCL